MKGMKVLIADDDEDQLVVREMLLQQSGFDPVSASSHESAMRAARATSPICAVLDFRFPDEKAGLQLIRDLKQFKPEMHIFVLTGGDQSRLERLPERQLIEQIFGKGTSSSILIERLRQLRHAEGYN